MAVLPVGVAKRPHQIPLLEQNGHQDVTRRRYRKQQVPGMTL
jgi:hypothetical protein